VQGQSGEKHGFPDRREAAICVEGDVGELGGAIAADTPPGHAGELHLQHFWNKDRAADAAARNLVVVADKASAKRKGHPVMKVAENAEGLHMDGAVGNLRVPGGLANDVGHLIEGDRIGRIEQRAARRGCIKGDGWALSGPPRCG
jgi:hypothetical protein